MKYHECSYEKEVGESHPTGVRGLKSAWFAIHCKSLQVAPHWGAWIEIGG